MLHVVVDRLATLKSRSRITADNKLGMALGLDFALRFVDSMNIAAMASAVA